MRAFLLLSLLVLASCARDDGNWPKLLPITGLLEAGAMPEAPSAPATLEGRTAALNARAERLRGSVIASGSLPGY